MMTKLFKPCFAFIAIALMAMFIFSPVQAKTSDEVKRKIDIQIGKGRFTVDRSLVGYADVSPFHSMGTIEVVSSDFKDAAVYVVDDNGMIVDYFVTDTSQSPNVMMQTPQSGTYYIIVDSPECCDECVIEVN